LTPNFISFIIVTNQSNGGCYEKHFFAVLGFLLALSLFPAGCGVSGNMDDNAASGTESEEIKTEQGSKEDTVFSLTYNDDGYLLFGTFEQDGDASNGPEPIEWQVLKEENGKLLVLSRYVLEERHFTTEPYCVWENSDVREYLNGGFYEKAFAEEEKARILATGMTNEIITRSIPKPEFADDGSVQDKVFLLSIKEYTEYFEIQGWNIAGFYASSYHGRCDAVPAARADVRPFYQSAYDQYYSEVYPPSVLEENSCAWLTRTVSPDGTEGLIGASIWAIDWNGATHPYKFRTKFGIRPAMWISLEP